MKYLKTFNESIRDLMTPKSEEEIKKSLKKLSTNEKLMKASRIGILWVVKEAIEEGANIETKDNNGCTPLHHASCNGHKDIVKLLLKTGANVKSINNYDQIPLDYAEYYDHNDVIELLTQYMNKTNESIKDFNPEEIKNKEINHFERELAYRKKMRSEDDNDYDFDELINIITDEIDTLKNHYITVSKKKDENYLEYESEEVGRVKIFNPKDEAEYGYFEVNGKMHSVDADEIRNFYHYLNQEMKKLN